MQCLEFGKAILPVYFTFIALCTPGQLHTAIMLISCIYWIRIFPRITIFYLLLKNKNKNEISKIYVGCNKSLFKFPIPHKY